MVGASFQPTVDSFVLFHFHDVRTLKLFQAVSVFCFSFRDVRTREIKPTSDHKQHCLTAVLFQTSAHP